MQEQQFCDAAGGCSPPNFWTPRVKLNKNLIFEILASREIERYMGQGRGGPGGSEFLGPPQEFFEALVKFNTNSEPSAQELSIGILFEEIG